jgi:hypothetical protein
VVDIDFGRSIIFILLLLLPTMIRTTLMLPVGLHQQLLITARQNNSSLSRLVRELISDTLKTLNKTKVKHTYRALNQLDGLGGEGTPDASTTVDDLLYGDDGAWKGKDAR